MWETQFSTHFITSFMMKSLDVWKTIFTTRLQLRKQQVSLLCFNYESELHQKLVRYTKEIYAMTCRIELLKNKLDWTQSTQNAWNACKKQSDKILQTENLLYVKDAWTIIQDKVQVEELRQWTCNEHEEKRYINDLKKIYKTTKSHRMKLLKQRKAIRKRWKRVMSELLTIYMNVEDIWIFELYDWSSYMTD